MQLIEQSKIFEFIFYIILMVDRDHSAISAIGEPLKVSANSESHECTEYKAMVLVCRHLRDEIDFMSNNTNAWKILSNVPADLVSKLGETLFIGFAGLPSLSVGINNNCCKRRFGKSTYYYKGSILNGCAIDIGPYGDAHAIIAAIDIYSGESRLRLMSMKDANNLIDLIDEWLSK